MNLDLKMLVAAAAGDARRVETLLSQGADANSHQGKPLLYAARVGSAPTISALLDHGAKPEVNALIEAARRGNADCVAIFAMRGKFSNRTKAHALSIVATCGKAESVALLIDADFPLHGCFCHPLAMAAAIGHMETVKLLITKGACITSHRHNALRHAFKSGHFEVGEYLLICCHYIQNAAFRLSIAFRTTSTACRYCACSCRRKLRASELVGRSAKKDSKSSGEILMSLMA